VDTWYQKYGHQHRYWHDESTTLEFIDDVYHVETKLYDVRSEGLIWSALSETVVMEDAIAQSDRNIIETFINVMVKKLSDDGLVKQF
ncbi:MAG: hypothetical protein GQ556_00305, partial [Desulfobacterales bacterium]|nr:hypothetical protein [Desulfobacterales bacterium]